MCFVFIQSLCYNKLGLKDSVETWRDQIGSIHSMDLLQPDKKVMGFSDDWESGAVEIVLHPLQNKYNDTLELFYSTSKIPKGNTHVG